MAIMALILASCGTTQKSATVADTTPVPAVVTEKVEANAEFISVAEAIDMFESPEKVASITKIAVIFA